MSAKLTSIFRSLPDSCLHLLKTLFPNIDLSRGLLPEENFEDEYIAAPNPPLRAPGQLKPGQFEHPSSQMDASQSSQSSKVGGNKGLRIKKLKRGYSYVVAIIWTQKIQNLMSLSRFVFAGDSPEADKVLDWVVRQKTLVLVTCQLELTPCVRNLTRTLE